MVARDEEDTVATRMVKALVIRTVNDITYETMGRIVHRLKRMSVGERGSEKKVADVLSDELGPEKALEYVEKAFAGGLITAKQYEALRVHLVFALPREKIPLPWAGMGRVELLSTQERLKEEFGALAEGSQKAFLAPMRALNKDVDRLRKAWGR